MIYDIIPMFFFCKNTHKLKHPSQSVEKKENQISVGPFSANDDFTTADYLVISVVKEVTKAEGKTCLSTKQIKAFLCTVDQVGEGVVYQVIWV